jgi:hypothetical protein
MEGSNDVIQIQLLHHGPAVTKAMAVSIQTLIVPLRMVQPFFGGNF